MARKKMTAAARAIAEARTALILDQPFVGALALRLKVREDPTCPTAWTDGRTLGYNPAFVESLTSKALIGLVGHEVLHCAMGHPWRRSGREHMRFNVACDCAIDPILVENGFHIPEGSLMAEEFNGKSAEWIYDRLPPTVTISVPGLSGDGAGGAQSGAGGQDGQGQGDGAQSPSPSSGGGERGVWGEVRDAPSDGAADGTTEEDWKLATQQAAAAAKARGSLPAGMERFAKDVAKPRVEWRSVLRRFVSDVAKADYTWRVPNRRYLAGGLYMPALYSEEMGPIAVAVDTSGSIDAVTLSQFGAELNAIAQDMKPRRVSVIYADADVGRIDVFEAGEPIELHPVGGGGTEFGPALRAMEELDEPPVCAVYLTDMYGGFPNEPPEFPVLWATVGGEEAPFGEVVPIR